MNAAKPNRAKFLVVMTALFACALSVRGSATGQVVSLSSPETLVKESRLVPIRVPSAVVKIADTIAVPAEHTGVLTKVAIREGDLLEKGQLIAKINDTELRLRLTKAKYENEIARLTAENDVDIRFSRKSQQVAEADVARSYRANSKVANSVPNAKVERQILERDRTALQLEQARRDAAIEKLKTKLTGNEIKLSELLLKKTEIRSPINGMVIALERRTGEWVEPSETVVRLVRIDRLRVEGFVSVEDAAKIEIDATAQVKFSQTWLKKQQYAGRVVFISPEANPVNSQLLVWVEINDEGNLLTPGLRGEILIDSSLAQPDRSAVAP